MPPKKPLKSRVRQIGRRLSNWADRKTKTRARKNVQFHFVTALNRAALDSARKSIESHIKGSGIVRIISGPEKEFQDMARILRDKLRSDFAHQGKPVQVYESRIDKEISSPRIRGSELQRRKVLERLGERKEKILKDIKNAWYDAEIPKALINQGFRAFFEKEEMGGVDGKMLSLILRESHGVDVRKITDFNKLKEIYWGIWIKEKIQERYGVKLGEKLPDPVLEEIFWDVWENRDEALSKLQGKEHTSIPAELIETPKQVMKRSQLFLRKLNFKGRRLTESKRRILVEKNLPVVHYVYVAHPAFVKLMRNYSAGLVGTPVPKKSHIVFNYKRADIKKSSPLKPTLRKRYFTVIDDLKKEKKIFKSVRVPVEEELKHHFLDILGHSRSKPVSPYDSPLLSVIPKFREELSQEEYERLQEVEERTPDKKDSVVFGRLDALSEQASKTPSSSPQRKHATGGMLSRIKKAGVSKTEKEKNTNRKTGTGRATSTGKKSIVGKRPNARKKPVVKKKPSARKKTGAGKKSSKKSVSRKKKPVRKSRKPKKD